MLKVTFRDLLPTETLLAIANMMYIQWHEHKPMGAEAIHCDVTIRRETFSAARFLVRVEVRQGRGAEVSATTAHPDPAVALSSGMRAVDAALAPAAAPDEICRSWLHRRAGGAPLS